MLRALLRLFLALGGSAFAALFVAFFEARSVTHAAAEASEQAALPFGAVLASELGLLMPVVFGIGLGLGVMALLLLPPETSARRWAASFRDAVALDRLGIAALVPISIVTVFVWCVFAARIAKAAMAAGTPIEVGLTIGVECVAALVATVAVGLASLSLVRRLLAVGSESVPQLTLPLVTGGAALGLVAMLFGLGILLGDTSGGGGGVLGIFGVLKRPELDLRPVFSVGVLAVGTLLAIAFAVRPLPENVSRALALRAAALAGTAALLLLLVVQCSRASSHIGDDPAVARGLEKGAPLGKIALAVLRKLTDHDKDGFSASFAGGDCNDRDKKVNPNALDVPGNGIDEDCSGADTPAATETPQQPQPVAEVRSAKPARTYNVIFLTVDTLRPDLGFMEYGKPTSPNLDKVAEKATVFERAYSMASYTGKAVGPMLIGKYPSETNTDFSHFNTYFESNVFLAERLHDAGVRTFAGMCHWYFRNPTGLKQGFDVWDTSAIPPGMGDNDNVITSERMGDLALKLLQRPENTLGPTADGALDAVADAGEGSDAGSAAKSAHRFFAWFHFFDPHAQYVPHEGAPDLSSKGPYGQSRTLYDQEVWFTDKHIGRVLDYIAAQPWAEDTAIVMTADHGEAFFEHGMMWHGSEIWEELVHVPLFVYVPGAEPRRVSQKRSHIDIVPTVLELMGIPRPEDDSLRGKSLLDDVYLPKGAEHDERDVYVDMPQGPFNGVRRALISGPSPGTKLIHSGGFNYQLFDLAADPDEKKDLATDKAKRDEAIARMNAVRGRLKEIEVKPR